MADSSGALQRPPSLREFLDSGPDLTTTDVWWERLAEVLYLELPFIPPSERARRADEARDRALRWCRGSARGRRARQERRERTLNWQWIADLYEEPELVEPVLKALPADIVDTFDDVAECIRQPYPLTVRAPETWWTCANCGASFEQEDQEQALIVAGREGFTVAGEGEDIRYCLRCVVAVLVAPSGGR